MKTYEPGVLNASNLYFHTPSEGARKMYFYPLCTGHYFCDKNYLVDRQTYDSFLLFYVVKGSGFVQINRHRAAVPEKSVVLLDCYAPHVYGTPAGWEILWVHFDGPLARAYFSAIAQGANCIRAILPDPQAVQRAIQNIYGMYHEQGKAVEPLMNKYLISALTELLMRGSADSNLSGGITEELLTYISENLHRPITLEEMAGRASLSPYYFTRLFKKETGYTPHEYLINARINVAKYYLKVTALPIKQIYRECGFTSECAFCTTFKRIVGLTPGTYRTSGL